MKAVKSIVRLPVQGSFKITTYQTLGLKKNAYFLISLRFLCISLFGIAEFPSKFQNYLGGSFLNSPIFCLH